MKINRQIPYFALIAAAVLFVWLQRAAAYTPVRSSICHAADKPGGSYSSMITDSCFEAYLVEEAYWQREKKAKKSFGIYSERVNYYYWEFTNFLKKNKIKAGPNKGKTFHQIYGADYALMYHKIFNSKQLAANRPDFMLDAQKYLIPPSKQSAGFKPMGDFKPYSYEYMPPQEVRQLASSLRPLVIARCDEVFELKAKIDKKWALPHLFTVLPAMVMPRIISVQIWGAQRWPQPFPGFMQMKDKVERLGKLANAAANFKYPGCDSFKGLNIGDMDAPSQEVLRQAPGICAQVKKCEGKINCGANKNTLILHYKAEAKSFEYLYGVRESFTKAQLEKEMRRLRQEAIRLRAARESAERTKFECDTSQESLLNVGYALEYYTEVLNNRNTGMPGKVLSFMGAGLIRKSGLAELQCISQKTGWDSVLHKDEMMGDSITLAANLFNCFLNMAGPAVKVPPVIKIFTKPITKGLNKANGISVSYPPGTQVVGYILDGAYIAASAPGESFAKTAGKVFTVLAKEGTTFMVEGVVPKNIMVKK
ncbi:hypothetical protein A2232_02910 [candidate division WOR-1 bacterium RIFOXYA2_FULL_46_56]|nr:MAG: hypothetical protein A2232_02910 [candidate division WOR-1 bacterium RIFOXYA2_FULL_46_56]